MIISELESSNITGRKYPDGESIPDSLPAKYKISNANERCDNCGVYTSSTKYCTTWSAVVRPEYVCAVWVPIKKI